MEAPPVREIRSARNPSFRKWRRWILDPSDSDCPCLPLEGDKHIRELLAERKARVLIVSESCRNHWQRHMPNAWETVILPDRLVDQLSPVCTSQGVLAFFDKPKWSWPEMTSRVIYADGLQDPGNLGTILRTAAATGLFSLVAAPGTVSCFNDKVVRASAGYLFAVPFLQNREMADLRRRGYRLIVANAEHGIDLYSFEFAPPFAVYVGREGGRASSFPEDAARLRIPMSSGVDSLNAGIASAVIMYEVLRGELAEGR